jgi:glycerol dehydrogenase
LADIGLGGVFDADLMKAAEADCAYDETIHNEPIPVTSTMVFSALQAANAEGRAQRNR